MDVHIGTSGWSYDHWAGILYPPSTPTNRRLEIYTRRFGTVELNSSFYRWPRERSFAQWHRKLPTGFRLSVKAPRGLTHAKRLHEPEEWVERLKASLHELSDHRGVLLVQLRPDHTRDDARLEYFLRLIPDWMRVAIEFRHPTWHHEDVFALLEHHGVGYCVMSGAKLPCILRVTADFAYVRMHGPDPDSLYAGSYPDRDLHWWADRIREWATTERDVYIYFNNDGEGHAVRNAETLRGLLR